MTKLLSLSMIALALSAAACSKKSEGNDHAPAATAKVAVGRVGPENDAAAVLAEKTAQAIKGRDDGTGDMGQCSELKHAAEGVANRADAEAAAKTLCDEILITSMVHRAFEEARANIAANKAELPRECSLALNPLNRLGTDWAKKNFDELFEVCNVQLGKIVLESERKTAKPPLCPDGVTALRKSMIGFKQTEKYPAFAAELAAVPGCT